MIPENITKDSISKALKKIDKEGVPAQRQSTKYLLIQDNKQYPTKYVISLANFFENGDQLKPDLFSGGDMTNSFLQKRGFVIKEISELSGENPE